jgi:hypothetical protein
MSKLKVQINSKAQFQILFIPPFLKGEDISLPSDVFFPPGAGKGKRGEIYELLSF